MASQSICTGTRLTTRSPISMRIGPVSGPPFQLMVWFWLGVSSHEDSVLFANGRASIEMSCSRIGTALGALSDCSLLRRFLNILRWRTSLQSWASLLLEIIGYGYSSMMARWATLISRPSNGPVFSSHFETHAILHRFASIPKQLPYRGLTA
jgi:hypothetical protein